MLIYNQSENKIVRSRSVRTLKQHQKFLRSEIPDFDLQSEFDLKSNSSGSDSESDRDTDYASQNEKDDF